MQIGQSNHRDRSESPDARIGETGQRSKLRIRISENTCNTLRHETSARSPANIDAIAPEDCAALPVRALPNLPALPRPNPMSETVVFGEVEGVPVRFNLRYFGPLAHGYVSAHSAAGGPPCFTSRPVRRNPAAGPAFGSCTAANTTTRLNGPFT